MDQIFASPEEDGKGRVLKIIHDFLVSEAEKHSVLEKGPISFDFNWKLFEFIK